MTASGPGDSVLEARLRHVGRLFHPGMVPEGLQVQDHPTGDGVDADRLGVVKELITGRRSGFFRYV